MWKSSLCFAAYFINECKCDVIILQQTGDEEPRSRSARQRSKARKRRLAEDSSDEDDGCKRGMTTRQKDSAASSSVPSISPSKRRRMTTRNQPDLTYCEWVWCTGYEKVSGHIVTFVWKPECCVWCALGSFWWKWKLTRMLGLSWNRSTPVWCLATDASSKTPWTSSPWGKDFYREGKKDWGYTWMSLISSVHLNIGIESLLRLILCRRYSSCEEFAADAQLVFNNCELFNEDTSDVGKAGHSMRRFFESRWAEFYENKDK